MDEKSGRELTFPIIRNDAREYWKTNCGDGWVRGGSGGRAGGRAGRQADMQTYKRLSIVTRPTVNALYYRPFDSLKRQGRSVNTS